MLNFNVATGKDDEPQWKVSILSSNLTFGHSVDPNLRSDWTRHYRSPLFSEGTSFPRRYPSFVWWIYLLNHFRLLNIKREPIPDVPAVYFVYPSKDNIKRICQDFESDLYSSYYLNFISPIPRDNLEVLAETALTEDCIQRIKKVFDQYTRFICLEDELFVLTEEPSNNEGTFYGRSSPVYSSHTTL